MAKQINLTHDTALKVMRSYIDTIGVSNSGADALLTMVVGKLMLDSARNFVKAEKLDKNTSVQCIISAMTEGIIRLNQELEEME